jgi:hypothetical protein
LSYSLMASRRNLASFGGPSSFNIESEKHSNLHGEILDPIQL